MDSDTSYISIVDAAFRMGVDHHYVRNLIKQGRISVDHTEPINASVSKVFVTKLSVKKYIEEHRQRDTIKWRVTREEKHAVDHLLASMRTLPDW